MFFYFCYMSYNLYHRKQIALENRYDMLYKHIQMFVDRDCSRGYFEYIMEKLIDLGQLQYKNREKTEILTCRFLEKYQQFMRPSDDDICEFNFDQLDADELVKRLKIQGEANKL